MVRVHVFVTATRQNYEEIKRDDVFLFHIYPAVERGHHARASPGSLNVA